MLRQEEMCNKDTCSIRILMEEEDKVVEEEAYSVKADTTKSNPENTTTTIGKTLQTRNMERLAKGGAIM